jgi:predicted transcriptional regulator
MPNVKEKMKEVIDSMPDDASYADIMRELAFDQMVEHGMQDVKENNTISHEEIKERIIKWQK